MSAKELRMPAWLLGIATAPIVETSYDAQLALRLLIQLCDEMEFRNTIVLTFVDRVLQASSFGVEGQFANFLFVMCGSVRFTRALFGPNGVNALSLMLADDSITVSDVMKNLIRAFDNGDRPLAGTTVCASLLPQGT